jgi:hypothetical protein
MDEESGTSSYALDIPNGGLSVVIGNLMQQGPRTDNYSMVNYGTEGLLEGRQHHLYVVNNTLVDDHGGGRFIQAASATQNVAITNNIFVGNGPVLSGPASTQDSNLQTTDPGLVSVAEYDYRLLPDSPARNAGTTPDTTNGIDLAPVFQYVHRSNRETRVADGAIDIGAYEYVP